MFRKGKGVLEDEGRIFVNYFSLVVCFVQNHVCGSSVVGVYALMQDFM